MTPTLRFAVNVDPTTEDLEHTYQRAQLADELGIDLITMQDHPYNRRFMDTMTVLTALAVKTERVHLGTNVASLPLRPPAMLAKQVASLDVISGGRVEFGLGAGAFWQGITAFGGQERTPGEAYAAFKDALHILRGMWDNAGRAFNYEGRIYSVRGAQPGPLPAHRIPIWTGAIGPKMLKLTGQLADGIWLSSSYITPERLLETNRLIDEGAAEAGRAPDEIRRGYNLMGIIDVGQFGGRLANLKEGTLYGSPEEWVEILTRLYEDYRQDTFNFWPAADAPLDQIRAFAKEVAPALRQAVTA
jgi:alkanesulfonate monooxygenase SsuD/methylene tetrahydromethanopterin reductase-like flavin-dependent oxidoreductase (luciferase family)